MSAGEPHPEYQEAYAQIDEMGGWRLFAGMMIYGISIFSFMALCTGWLAPDWIQYSALGAAFDWLWYGIFDGITALVSFVAASAVWQRRKFGYYLGLVIATLSAARWFLFLPGAPFFGLVMILVWILVVYGLIHDRNTFK